MPMPAGYTKAEADEFFNARLSTIEAVLSAVMPGFNSDVETFAQGEVNASVLAAASKTKINADLTAIKEKTKPRK